MRLGLDCRGSISDRQLSFGRQLGATDVIAGGAALARDRSASGPPQIEEDGANV